MFNLRARLLKMRLWFIKGCSRVNAGGWVCAAVGRREGCERASWGQACALETCQCCPACAGQMLCLPYEDVFSVLFLLTWWSSYETQV